MFSISGSRITNASLKPEKIRTVSLDTTYYPFDILRTELVGYFSKVEDSIILAQTSVHKKNKALTFLNQFQNTGSAEIFGFDLSLRATFLGMITSYIRYSFVKARQATNGPKLRAHDQSKEAESLADTLAGTNAITSDVMPRVATHKMNVGVNMLFFNHLNVDIRANFVGDRPNIKTNRRAAKTKGYGILNVLVGSRDWPLNGMDFSVRVFNVLDNIVFDPGVRSATGEQPSVTPVLGRFIAVELTHRL